MHAPNTSMRTHSGVGFHHGSLSQADRRIVEHLFVSRALFCLFATSTLAVGANLPAYLVIIKSTIQVCGRAFGHLCMFSPLLIVSPTKQYCTVAGVASWAEYDSHRIQQMAGRAGRPGFDTEGKCLILTQEHHVAKYRDIMNVQVKTALSLNSQFLSTCMLGLCTVS